MSLHSKRLIMINQICRYLISKKFSQNFFVTKLDFYQPEPKNESSFNYFIWIGILNDNRIGLEKCHYEVLIDPNFKVHVMLHFEGAPKMYCNKVRNYFKWQNIGLTEVDPLLINSYTKQEDKDRWVWYKYVPITSGNDSISDCHAEISLNQIEQNPSPENTDVVISDETMNQIASSLSSLIDNTKQEVDRVLGVINGK